MGNFVFAMRIFIYEYACCQPREAGSAADALRAEGWAMLSAVLEDFNAIPGVSTLTLLADDFPSIPFICRRTAPGGEGPAFRELAATADYTLVIAPELDRILLDRCRWVLEAGGRLLGPTPEAVSLAGDKLLLADTFHRHHVPTPSTTRLDAVLATPDRLSFPAVCKLRRGAGSLHVRFIAGPDDLRRFGAEQPVGEFVVQPFVPGMPASAAFLLGPRQRLTLPPAAQLLSDDGCFSYRGGSAPLAEPLATRAARIAESAVTAMSGLHGYVGVDLVLGEAPDGSADQVIEINPRLTTSYVGLRTLARFNLAEALLQVACGGAVPEPRWDSGPVNWTPENLG